MRNQQHHPLLHQESISACDKMKVKFAGHIVVPCDSCDAATTNSKTLYQSPRRLSGCSEKELGSEPTENGDSIHSPAFPAERKTSVFRIRYVYDDGSDTMEQPIIYRRHPITGEETRIANYLSQGQQQLEALRPILDSMEPMVKRLVNEYKENYRQKFSKNGVDSEASPKCTIHPPLKSREMSEPSMQQLSTNQCLSEFGFAHLLQNLKRCTTQPQLENTRLAARNNVSVCFLAETAFQMETFHSSEDLEELDSALTSPTTVSNVSPVFTPTHSYQSTVEESGKIIYAISQGCKQDRIQPIAKLRRGAVIPSHYTGRSFYDATSTATTFPKPKPRTSRGNSLDRNYANAMTPGPRKSGEEMPSDLTRHSILSESQTSLECSRLGSNGRHPPAPLQRSTVYMAKVNVTVTEEKEYSSSENSTFIPASPEHDLKMSCNSCFSPIPQQRQRTPSLTPSSNHKMAWTPHFPPMKKTVQ